MTALALVTDADCPLGRAIVDRLASRGDHIRALSRAPGGPATDRVARFPFDALARAFAGVVSRVIHIGPRWSTPSAPAPAAVIDASLRAEAGRLVHVSSTDILHLREVDGQNLSELSPYDPRPEWRGSAVEAQLRAEQAIIDAARERDLPALVLRPGSIVGAEPWPPPHLPLIVGDGSRRLPWVYIDDVVDAVLLAARSDAWAGQIVHLVDPDAPTEAEIFANRPRVPRSAFALGERWLLPLLESSPWAGRAHRWRSQLSRPHFVTHNASRLGWRPRVGVREGLDRVERKRVR
ncbi:MAG: NAD(P)-dependent oxidoreductase [Myxococcota bacterium]